MASLFTLAVPKEYGYVVLVAASSFVLSTWHGARIAAFRKPAGVAYPASFASTEEIASASPEKKQALYLFNCAQRAHGNFLENHLNMLGSMLLAGLRWPVASAALGAAWCVSRTVYAVGYTRKDKQNGAGRLAGLWFFLCQLGLYGMVGTMGVQMLR